MKIPRSPLTAGPGKVKGTTTLKKLSDFLATMMNTPDTERRAHPLLTVPSWVQLSHAPHREESMTSATKFTSQQLRNLENAEERAIAKALEALSHPCTPCRVAEFYDPTTNYAGATFAQLEPRDNEAITAADLIATTTLSVDIPPLAVRRFLTDKDLKENFAHLLSKLPQTGLEEVTEAGFVAMCDFYDPVKDSLAQAGTKSSNPWVTASKITARKRPDLFPVRDNVVCDFLGISSLRDRALDWRVFQSLIRQDDINDHLEQVPAKAETSREGASLLFDKENLRLLDAALWRFASGGGGSARLCPTHG